MVLRRKPWKNSSIMHIRRGIKREIIFLERRCFIAYKAIQLYPVYHRYAITFFERRLMKLSLLRGTERLNWRRFLILVQISLLFGISRFVSIASSRTLLLLKGQSLRTTNGKLLSFESLLSLFHRSIDDSLELHSY